MRGNKTLYLVAALLMAFSLGLIFIYQDYFFNQGAEQQGKGSTGAYIPGADDRYLVRTLERHKITSGLFFVAVRSVIQKMKS